MGLLLGKISILWMAMVNFYVELLTITSMINHVIEKLLLRYDKDGKKLAHTEFSN